MRYLYGTKSYLAGPIEFDHGKDWRQDPLSVLQNEFGVNVHNPYMDDKQSMFVPLQKAIDREDFDEAKKITKSFVKKDLMIVQKSDFVTAYVPHGVPTIGTVHEIIFADSIKLPVMLICPQGKKKVGKWYFGIVDHNMIFGSWADYYSYLREVNDGKHKDNFRWSFVYGLI